MPKKSKTTKTTKVNVLKTDAQIAAFIKGLPVSTREKIKEALIVAGQVCGEEGCQLIARFQIARYGVYCLDHLKDFFDNAPNDCYDETFEVELL